MAFRYLYSLLWYLLAPVVAFYLVRRSKRQPAYRLHWHERFMGQMPTMPSPPIWLHAVSVGETRAAIPLVKALQDHFPQLPILITQMTPTGRDTARQLFANMGCRGQHIAFAYLPYDMPHAVQRFLSEVKPRVGVLMETEVWPNLIHAAHKRHIPLFLVNARLSERSARGYRRIRPLIAPALRQLTQIAAQTQADADRFTALASSCSVTVVGNTKFDVRPTWDSLDLAAQFRLWCGERSVLVAASTREGEEALLLDALPADFPALLVIVPRHPERFADVAKLLEARHIPFQRRSEKQPLRPETRVWLGDSMGELFAYYRIADVAFIGGSLLPLGGQNLIEAACLGVPIVMGPSDFNFSQVTALAAQAGALQRVDTPAEVFEAAAAILHHPTLMKAMGAAGLAFAAAHQGATERILNVLLTTLANQDSDSLSVVSSSVESGHAQNKRSGT